MIKTVVITGAASDIGHATAIAFAPSTPEGLSVAWKSGSIRQRSGMGRTLARPSWFD